MVRIVVALALAMQASAVMADDVVSPSDGTAYHVAQYWSGEWPPGVAVSKSGVSVMGRNSMDKAAPAGILCDLPRGAVFHPWNETRTGLSKARYVSVSKIVILTAKKDFKFVTDWSTDAKIDIRKGEKIEYLVYGAEGMFTVRIHGKEYEGDQSLFEDVEEVTDDQFTSENWLNLDCENGQNAWLMLDDLQKTEGIWRVQMGGPVNDYGNARDLTEDEIKKGLEQ